MAALAITCVGCASTKAPTAIQPVEPIALSQVCVASNPKVVVKDFLPVLQDVLTRRGVIAEVYHEGIPEKCKDVLRYTARIYFDQQTLLKGISYASLQLEQRGRGIRTVEYRVTKGMSLATTNPSFPYKWESTDKILNDLADRLILRQTNIGDHESFFPL